MVNTVPDGGPGPNKPPSGMIFNRIPAPRKVKGMLTYVFTIVLIDALANYLTQLYSK